MMLDYITVKLNYVTVIESCSFALVVAVFVLRIKNCFSFSNAPTICGAMMKHMR